MSERYIPKVGDKFYLRPKAGYILENDPVLTCVGRAGDSYVELTGLFKDGSVSYAFIDFNDFIPECAVKTSPQATSVASTLEERGRNYGPYKFQATISQGLKDVIRKTPGYGRMAPYQQESLDMFANKIGRILNGDPNYVDSWLDIAGYAQLVVDQLNGKNT